MGKDLFNDRISRFSIRKLNVGVCSVLLGTLVMVGTASQVSADETANQVQAGDVASTTATVSDETSSQNAVTAQASTEVANFLSISETNSQSQTVSNASAATSETSTTQASSETTSQAASSTSASTAASTTSVAGSTSVGNTTGVSTTASVTSASSETPASETASEAQGVDVQAEASTTNALSSGAEASAVVQPVVTAETSGRRRTRRALGDANDPNLIGDDVEDATSTPKVEKPGFTTDLDAKSMTSQISWLDFGDVANWTGAKTIQVAKNELKPNELEESLALQVGATYTKEIMPGYVVTVKVKSLKPFQATEIYKKRMEEQGATEAEKATYDPNAKNGYVKGVTSPIARQYFNDGKEADVIADAQNRWTEVKHENVDTKAKKTTMSSAYNGGNIGIQFEISATFRGKKVKPAIVMADGESANPGEFVMFTTNGQGWQHIGEWKKTTRPATSVPYEPQDTENLFGSKPKYNNINLRQLRDNSPQAGPDKKPVAWKYFGNPDQVTSGLGTGIFGPNISEGNRTVPLVMTRGASEVGLYIASAGKQSAMLGFFPLDEGDAPESYGKAVHTIATVDGVTGAKVNQPYLGNVSPDMDENTVLDWFGDDKATTADEGINQLLPSDLKGTTNEMIKMDRTRPGNYKMSVEAHLDGASEAHIYGWVDFNQNGKFDEDERSNLATITQDGTVELTFANSKTYIDPSVNELGARVRIAKKATEIESPTGMAFSGEVEDFKTQITHPPKGEFKETSGPQATKQTATVTFTARGEHKYEANSHAVIDETVEPYIVDKDGNRATLDAEGYYVVPGQGKYKITANGKDVDVEFIPEDNFLGTADGISIRRSDNNGYDTGWSTKFPDQEANINGQLNTMDGQYVPTVTPIEIEGVDKTSTDVQGATQKETPTFNTTATNLNGDKIAITPSAEYPAKLVDPATGRTTDAPSVTVEGEGTYTINPSTGEVTFTPEPSFTGTAKGVDVTLSAPVGRNKDGKIQQDYIKTATAKYTPTVTPITVTPTDKVSADVQNVPQTQTPTFDLSNDKTAEITSKKLVDPATGQPTDETTVTVAGEGSYTIDPTTGAVTFTPEKDFVGTAKGVTVQATATITNANGKTATITSDATYTPTVVPAVPTANPATSKDIQGATQTGTPTFAGTTVQVNGEDKAITIKDNSYTLLDNDGNEVTSTPAYAADGTTEIGTYSIDSATGQVTFTPTDKSYTGVVTPAKVQAESSNGIKVDTTYTPEIVPVTPTATPAETEDIQGATQTGKPEFKGGTVTVDGVEKTVAINEAVPATFDDGSTTKTVDGVGTYTVAADGTVTFVPEKSFVGTAPAVTVVREDKNGTKASATYTPTVTPVTPTAAPAESTDVQGATQTGKPVFTEGNSRVPMNDDVPATFDDGSTTKSVDGVGTYTVAADGTVTFVPEPSFTGTAPAVTVVREDKNGTKASATYTPSVTPITVTPTDKVSADIQNVPQTQTPTFDLSNDKTAEITSKKLVDPATGQPTDETTVTVAGEGSYTIDPTTGAVTFTPEKDFVGTAKGVTVQATATITNANGKTATITSDATYTPTVVPAVPTANPATSKDIQGATQTGTPTFAGTTVQVNGEDKAITIKDNSYTLLDNDGNEVTSTPAYAADGTTEIGTYSIDSATGQVTFTPTDKSYTGVVTPAKVQAESSNGIKVDTTYTPEIVPVTPTATPAETKDIQGATQTGKPEFKGGTVTVDGVEKTVAINEDVPATFDDGSTTKTVDGVGTYTVAADGTVTFVPEKSFVGTAPAVTVVREDKNGTKASATYTPTVTPVTPTATPVETTGKQGQTQTGKPEFTEGDSRVPMNDDVPATFDDGSTTKTVDGVGTYTVAADGTVTFVPEKSFTGTAPAVTVVREDKNGTKASATYTPTVTPVTPTATPAESTGPQGLVQTGTVTFTEGDEVAPINKDSITLLDETGQPAASVEAKSPAGDVIGTFIVDKETGVVTFTPTDKSYSGDVVPVKVQAADTNGTTVETTYTPKITPVVPTSEDATTTDIQGATQTGKPTFTEGDPNVPIDEDTPATFEDGSTTKTVDGEGTYTVSPDGTVTFVPEKSFTGTASGVTVKRVDKNGTEITAKYTPTVTPVTPTATPVETTGKQGQTQTGKPEFTEGDSRVPMNDDVPATFDDGSTTKTVDGVGTYTVAADGTVTFVPEKSFTGKAPAVTVVREDKNGTKASATYTPTVTPVTPTATPAESTGPQGLVQTGTVTFTEGDPVAPIDKDTITLLDETGQPAASVEAKSPAGDVIGTFTVDKETGVVTFTPTDKSYSGDVVPVKVQAADTNGTTVETTYTPKITPVVPTSEDATSTDIQGQTQSGKPTFTEGNPNVPIDEDTPATFEDGSTTKTVDGEGTYTVAPDGTVTFVPEKSFTGTASGVTVKRVDKNGTEITAKYTPTVTPVTPTATPVETTDIQGATQTGKPVFTEGDSRVPMNDDVPATFDDGSTTKTVDGVGTYTVAADGTVTFVPEKSFTGKAPAVTVVREDKNGTKASATYTPTVTPVTPTATPAESTGPQGLVQTGTVTFTEGDPVAPIDKDTITLLDENGQPAASVEAKSPAGDVIGTFTVDKETGVVTFTPTDKSYSGDVVAVKVQAADTNGTIVETTYTPKITPVVPTSEDATSTDIQGATQTGKPSFTEGNPNVPIDEDTPATFEDGSTTKTVDGEGTYTVAPDGTVTFVPEKSFTGTATGVTVKRVDKNGTEITAKYTPTVTPVTPTATPVETTDIQGATQTGKPVFTEGDSRVSMNDDVPATFDDGSTTKTVDGVGTYTVAADGTVTFVPEKSFVGTAPAVTVVREDKNGTKASATYTPTVTPVTPTAEDTTSTDKQGQTQTGTPTFTPGNPNVPMDDDTPATFEDGSTTKTVPGEGTYTVASDGTVTFVPEKSFTGEGTGVTVKRVDKNGTPVTAKYTPTVTPVTPTATPAESEAPQGVVQTGTVTFTEGDPVAPIDKDTITLLDENGQPVESVVAKSPEGKEIGTFTVDKETGVVTFTPTDKSYSGDVVPVKVQAADTNGTRVETTYTPKITPVVPTADPATSTDIQGQTQTGTPSFTPGNPAIPMDDDVPATFEDGSTTKVIPGEGTYTVAPDGTVTFVPEKSFTGEGTGVTVKRVDKNGTPATAKYTPTVTPVTPTATPVETTGKQGQTQTGKPEFTEGDSRVPMNDDVPATFDDGSTTKTVDGVGTYTVASDGTVTFVPEKSFTGTAPAVTVVREDKNGTKASATYTPTVTPVTPTATPAESEAPQGVVQTGTVTFTEGDPVAPIDKDTITLLDENGQPAASVDAKSPAGDVIGTFIVDKETGVVTFTPTDKSYSGDVVPVKVQGKDTNGTVAETTYTPKITPVVPTADPATSTDIQGQTQTGKPTFTEGNPNVPIDEDTPATFEDGSTTKVIPGEGTYTVAPDGTVTFVPEKSFTGEGTGVTVKRVDKNGTPATAKYTPTVTPVTPTATPVETTGKQGQTQTGKPEFTEGDSRVPMNDDVPATFDDGTTTKTVDGVGTYTVAADGTVTFVPEKSFVGTAPAVTVVREDKNGTKASATYTPTVTPVTPTATPAESTGPQGVVQTGTVTFTEGDSVAPIDKDTITLLDETGQPAAAVFAKSPAGDVIGTFTVDKETGVVTFIPTNKSYSGDVVPVKVQAADTNGTTVETTYTTKITPVVPTSEDATSTDIQGQTQSGKPTFTEGNPNVPIDEDAPATFEDGSTTKTVDGEGTYTVAPDGTVTFVTEKSFVGTATGVTVKRVDKNGTEITAKYTPTVTPVTPTAEPTTSTDIQGATQTGKPVFTEGDSRVPMNDDVPATFDGGSTTKTVDGVGTYTVAADGTVTFVPEKSFVGTAPAVTVVREDKNGTKASATYTPTVTPVTPTSEPATSTDIQGQTQTGKPSFTPGNPSVPMDDDVPATFEDGSTTKVIPGEGTYTVAPDGTVTFVPEKAFTGTGTGVTVKRVDKNGTAVTATYTPTVTPVTPTAESVTSIGNKGQTQTGKPSFTEGDSRVPMNNQVPATFEDGSTTKTIAGVGTYTVAADGTVTFTPETEFTGTAPAVTVVREDVNGTKASATYTPTVLPITKFVDKEGKEIPGYPTVDGEQPKAEIPGYRFVETKKLPNGDVEHVYEQVTTSYVDENGTPIPGYPTEDGQQPKKEIPGYEFVKTIVDENGNTQHIYKQIVTPTPVPDTTPTLEPQPAPQTEEPKAPVLPETKEEAHFINPSDKTAQLPETGSEDSNLAIFGLASLLAGFGLYGGKRRKR
ncbi:GEVED domain-containing protein [Streptococcus sp. SS4]|nr:GEVED domain-containing protein [Streptococcus sp. SS4]MDN5035615.1 CshA/CshB family fibrillar adhesin-related protein [Streptococcus sp. SS4]